MSIKYINSVNIVAIILLIVLESIVFGLRCKYQEAVGDEVMYEFVWENDDNTNLWDVNHRLERRVSSFSDIVQSQKQHYKYANGRSLVHAGEQAFTGHKTAFSVINTIIFILFTFLIILYCGGIDRAQFLSSWILVFIALLFLFPENQIWTSINFAPNYLWPAFLSVVVLWVWKKLRSQSLQPYVIPFLILLGFIFGWSHEGYVIPVAGGIFFFYLFNFKQFRGQIIWMAIPMWISALFMILSPGNLNRFLSSSAGGGGMVNSLFTGLSSVLELWIFILFAVFVFAALIFNKKKQFKYLIRNEKSLLIVILISFCFSILIHTGSHSFTPLALFILLFLLQIIFRTHFIGTKIAFLSSVLISILFGWQQILVARDNIVNYEFQRDIINKYISSSDGIVKYNSPLFSWYTKPWVKYWDLDNLKKFVYYQNWNKAYSQGVKEPLFLEPEDYKAALGDPSFFIPSNKIPGNAPVYKSANGSWIWIDPSRNSNGGQFVAELEPVDFNHNVGILIKIKFALFPNGYPETEELKVDTIMTRNGETYRIAIPEVRKIKSIRLVSICE